MRRLVLFVALSCASAPLFAQIAPSVQFLGCGGQTPSGLMSFTGSINGSVVTLQGSRTGASSYTIYWGNGARQDNAPLPTGVTRDFANTQANYSFQIHANTADGTSDCIQGKVLFLPTCLTTVDPTQFAVPSTGGTFSVSLTQSGACTVPINEVETWITPQTPSVSELKVDIAANTATSPPRTGLLHIAENVVTFNQAGFSCAATLSSRGVTVGAGSSSAQVSVSIPAGCAWTISSVPSWVTTSPLSAGSGPLNVTLTFAANTSSLSRSASLVIAGERLDVVQAGTRCLYTISPSSRNVPPGGETASFKISAATGCGWTAVPSASWITIVGNPTGSGPGEIQFSVASNPSTSVRRTGTIRVGGQTFVITQMPQGPNMRCEAQEFAVRQLRFGGTTELLPDLVFDCFGTAPSRATTVEFTLRLNVPVTSKIVNTTTELTEALLMLDFTGSGSPVLGGNVRLGRLAGPNALRWTVPISSFLSDNEFQFRFTNVRANTAGLVIGTRTPPPVRATLEMKSVETISVDSGPFTLGQAVEPIDTSVGQPLLFPTEAANVRVPVSVSERFIDVFRPQQVQGQTNSVPGQEYLSESGYMHSALGNAAIGLATTGTRIRVQIPGIPAGVRIFADHVSTNGEARLTSADANGAGGAILPATGSPRQLTVSNGVATATWEIVSAVSRLETVVLNLHFDNATAAQISSIRAGITARLGPVSGIASASATAPIPRFADPFATETVNLRIVPGAVFIPPINVRSDGGKAPLLMARGYEQVGSNFVFNYDVYNDSSSTADDTVVRGNAPPGFQYTSCSGGNSCNVSGDGSTMQADLGDMAPGATTTVQVQATQTDTLPSGTYVENSLDVSTSDLDSDVDSNSASGGFIVEACGALAVVSAQFQSPGGNGSATAPAGCNWTATSTVDWITLTGATSGSASGPVTFNVSANDTISVREGSIIIGGRTFTVRQRAFCTFIVNSLGVNATATAGNTGVFVNLSGDGCSWTATPNQPWVSVNPPSASAPQIVTVSWQANNSTTARSATVTFGDGVHTAATLPVNQSAAVCTFALSAPSATAAATGGSSTFTITTNGTTCPWTATSDSVWLTVTPANGTTTQTLTWTAAANGSTSSRTGTITAGGQTFTVTQGGTCTGSLVTSSANVGAAGGFGVFALNIGAGCGWTAVSSQPWLDVSPGLGNGQATLNWNASTNTTLAQRSATIAVAGQTFTVTQAPGTCSFTLAEPGTAVPHTGGSGTVALTPSSATCAWTARSNVSWAQVSPISGTGSTPVSFTVFPNFNSTGRAAQLTIAGQTYTITQQANPGTLNQRFVRLLYFSFLGRVPDEAEVNFHANSGLTRGQLAINFLRAEEFNIGGRFTAGLYVGLLNRDPEYGGWQFQRNALARGFINQWTIIDNFINSAEYKGKFGTPTDIEYVRLLYRYVLLREPGPGEAEFHAGTIPQLGRSGVARSFLNSLEFRNGTQARLNAFLLFATLLLRDGSAEELAFRRQQLQAGGDAALQSVVNSFAVSPEIENLLK